MKLISVMLLLTILINLISLPVFAQEQKILSIETAVRDSVIKSQSADGLLYRADGWCYAVDIGNLLIYAALVKDEVLFNSLLATIKKHFIIKTYKDENADSTVVWRKHPLKKPDASGTTESLRILKGVWYGYKQWGKPELRELAVKMTTAYGKHQTTVNGSWFIRNYYDYRSKTYAINTYTIGYDPDLLFDIGNTLNNAGIIDMAEKSRQFITAAQASNGLIHIMYDLEIETYYPGQKLIHFSPNYIMKPGDSAEISTMVIKSAPKIAEKTLVFMKGQWPHLYNDYYGNDSQPFSRSYMSIGHLANVLILAHELGDDIFADAIADKIIADVMTAKKEQAHWDMTNVLMAIGYYRSMR